MWDILLSSHDFTPLRYTWFSFRIALVLVIFISVSLFETWMNHTGKKTSFVFFRLKGTGNCFLEVGFIWRSWRYEDMNLSFYLILMTCMVHKLFKLIYFYYPPDYKLMTSLVVIQYMVTYIYRYKSKKY